MIMIKTGIVLIALLIAGAPASAEELYRWVDKDGKVHFGDRPPPQAEPENIGGELRPLNTADAARSQLNTRTRQRTDPQKAYRDKQRRRELQQQQQKARACTNARRRLRIMQGRVAFIDENGKEIKMTERERRQEAERLRREISRVCG